MCGCCVLAEDGVRDAHESRALGDMYMRQASGPDALQASMVFVGVAFHGMAVSHIDALCHVFVDGRMYNGHPASAVTTRGARHGASQFLIHI